MAPRARPTVITDARWPELPARPLVLVPLGATEQHGPHLPFDTDVVIASAVTTALAGRLDGDVVVAPAIAYGASGEHQAFPGTASVGERVLLATIVELARSLGTWAGRVVLVNGHGGNVRALAAAVVQLREEGHRIGWTPCGPTDGDSHAGRTETSLLLHLRPERVRLDLAEPGDRRPLRDLLPRLTTEGVRAVSPNGVLGDPGGATAGEGAALFERIVDDCLRRVRADAPDAHGMLAP